MKVFAILAIAATCASAQRKCGSTNPPAELKVEATTEPTDDLVERSARRAKYTVDTYVHVITTQNKSNLYPRSMVQEQMRVMNEAYASSRIAFNTKSIDYTVNDRYASASYETPEELEYKTLLHKGGYDDLNLYFLSDLGDGLLGFCYFPEKKPTATQLMLDGCVNLAGSMPGGETRNYNLGATAVHEAGHWFGLFHTFQDDGKGCAGKGDYVADTPAQLNATAGCPTVNPDTCPKNKGVDPIHNWMDYSTDICMTEFSFLQSLRMRVMYATRRRPNRDRKV
ncbi:Putative peptidase M43, pregnancy-associated plasma-A [Septoria linicola]|uniref:Peptidase M43, pregnancy-associated plasma-A n=1 Tax=Septoria linicola TaxID=215465 RepID=A0A9Q9EN29_9PEZI|nr:putative peptidase M43, pregnancy-associated plasma-A [Septoria linicola]USW57361.1 Putative peptidase M43, pregnancy-associated plasma-A [Septoria linicola]